MERIEIMDKSSLTLEEYKVEKFKDIDDRTNELITQGFPYNGKVFSMSFSAQINITALYQSKDLLTYPIKYNTVDDLDTYNVVDAADLANMYFAALTTKKGHIDAGTALKDLVRVAATKEEVDLVIDNR